MKRLCFWCVVTVLYVLALAAVATIPAAGEGFLGIVFWFFLGYCAFILVPQLLSAISAVYRKTAGGAEVETSRDGAAG